MNKSNDIEKKDIIDIPDAEMLKETASDKLCNIIDNRHIKQSDIVNNTGLSRDTVSKAINGKCLSLSTAIAFCKYLNISLDYLFELSVYENAEREMNENALKLIQKHIKGYQRKVSFARETPYNIPSITFSNKLARFLEAQININGVSGMPEDLKKEWEKREIDEFLKCDTEDTKKIEGVEFALLRNEYQNSEKILSLLEENRLGQYP